MTTPNYAPVKTGSSTLSSTAGVLPTTYDSSSMTGPAVVNEQPDQTTMTYPLSGGGYGYGYGYGASGSSTPTQTQKDTVDLLAPIAKYGNDEIVLNQGKNSLDALNTADDAAKKLSQFQGKMAMSKAGAEWFSNLLKEQSAYQALKSFMGNAFLGSGWMGLNTLVQRNHDATAATILETLQSNLLDNAVNLYQTLQSNANSWNENAADIETKLREGFSDYATQLVNIHPDIASGKEEGYDAVVDKDAKTLNTPDWLTTDYYDENKKGVVDMPWVPTIRPDKATETSWDKGLNPNRTNNSGAANTRYWEALGSYGQRRR